MGNFFSKKPSYRTPEKSRRSAEKVALCRQLRDLIFNLQQEYNAARTKYADAKHKVRRHGEIVYHIQNRIDQFPTSSQTSPTINRRRRGSRPHPIDIIGAISDANLTARRDALIKDKNREQNVLKRLESELEDATQVRDNQKRNLDETSRRSAANGC